MTTRHKTADTGLSLPCPLSTPVLLTADIMLQSSCGSSGPGCGYIAPSTIRLTSVWTQTCINLQEDKPQVLHRLRVYLHIKSSAGVAAEEMGGECSDTNTARHQHPDSRRQPGPENTFCSRLAKRGGVKSVETRAQSFNEI